MELAGFSLAWAAALTLALEIILHRRRRGEYQRIQSLRSQAQRTLREAQLSEMALRAMVRAAPAPRNLSPN